jgi:hypothetical protein
MASVFTTSQYQTLCAAIAQGVTEVWYGDKKVVYRSLSEMKQIKSMMEADLNIDKPARTRYIKHSKGLQ